MKAKYITPAVTVFSEDGSIHFEEQGKVYEHLIAGGVDGILLSLIHISEPTRRS